MSKNIKNILVIILIISISSGISVMANTLIDSKEVIYDNKKSGMESTNVQAAVDELYSAATDYSNINQRVNNLEQYSSDIYTAKGLSIVFTKVGRLVEVKVYGSTSEALSTSNAYVPIFDIPTKYVPLNAIHFRCLLNSQMEGMITTDQNRLTIGYTNTISSNIATDYPKGGGAYLHFTYISKN